MPGAVACLHLLARLAERTAGFSRVGRGGHDLADFIASCTVMSPFG
jgi:hypothetical protein